MAHARNLSKGSPIHRREEQSRYTFCGLPETQQSINIACTHRLLAGVRKMHRRYVDDFFQTNIGTSIYPADKD
jgi:hypothetical protein